jgi:hypothetical protein
VNARTFRDRPRGTPIYEPVLAERRVRRRRPDAEAELCFPLTYKQTKIGVVNFESPIQHGFDLDVAFVGAVVAAIEQHLVLLLEANDQRGLASRARIQHSLHEIQHIIDEPAFPGDYRARLGLHMKVLDGTAFDERRLVPLSELRTFLERYLEEMRTSVGLPSIADSLALGCRIFLETPDLHVSSHWMDVTQIIFKNLLDNIREHGDASRDSLTIRQPAFRDGAHISFRLRSSATLPEAEIADMLFTPLRRSDRLHFGMFLVGAMARYLGGYAHVGNERRGVVLVSLPIPGLTLKDT